MNKTLEHYGTNELIAEIEKRKQKERESIKPLDVVDLKPIIKIWADYVEFLSSGDYHEDNDFEYYVYETTLTAVYGDQFWDWKRKLNE